MSTYKPVKTILLHVTQSHIDQARALRRISLEYSYINAPETCPVALTARKHFGRPCNATTFAIAVYEENDPEIHFMFRHNGAHFINSFDRREIVSPTTITLTRYF